MLEPGPTWFLTADGRRARIWIEPRRGAALEAPAELAMEIAESELYAPQDRPPRSFDRKGEGRHAMDGGRDLHEEEEEKFLARVAAHLAEAEKRGAFAHLAIAAPPRALGRLRNALTPAVRARLRAEAPKDLLDESAQDLRTRLTDMLRGA